MTRFYRSGRLAVLAASGWLVSACADSVGPKAPLQVASSVAAQASEAAQAAILRGNTVSTLTTSLITTTHVNVLTRRQALASDYSVSGNIGPAGGSLTIAAAGVTITFPPNAVSATTFITMRALSGRTVAYEFAPHGLNFGAKPTIKQDLTNINWTNVLRGALQGAYYSDQASLNRDLAVADAAEFFLTNTPDERTLTFAIPHFSGYLVSSGRSSTY
jgi:hypothetical protein